MHILPQDTALPQVVGIFRLQLVRDLFTPMHVNPIRRHGQKIYTTHLQVLYRDFDVDDTSVCRSDDRKPVGSIKHPETKKLAIMRSRRGQKRCSNTHPGTLSRQTCVRTVVNVRSSMYEGETVVQAAMNHANIEQSGCKCIDFFMYACLLIVRSISTC